MSLSCQGIYNSFSPFSPSWFITVCKLLVSFSLTRDILHLFSILESIIEQIIFLNCLCSPLAIKNGCVGGRWKKVLQASNLVVPFLLTLPHFVFSTELLLPSFSCFPAFLCIQHINWFHSVILCLSFLCLPISVVRQLCWMSCFNDEVELLSP